MNIFLRYEIAARELDANILTGLIAASRGHRAIVCDWPMMMRGILLRRRRPGFVHMNSLTPGKATPIFHKIFKFFGYRISSMDQEAGIQQISYQQFANARYGDSSMSGADLVFCWGPEDYEILQQIYPEHSGKIIMSGSPRVDLWRPKFSGIYASSNQMVEPFFLVLSSIAGPLSRRGFQGDLGNLRRGGYTDRQPDAVPNLIGQYKEGADLMLEYLDLVRFLSLNHPAVRIVVKPHPSEDPEIWRAILSGVDCVSVDTETPTPQLIRQCLVAITTGSTTAFEAVLAETPLVSFQPTETPHRNFGAADCLGIRAETVERVHKALLAVTRAGNNPSAKPHTTNSNTVISRKLYFDDRQLAAERMVIAWEMALRSDDSPQCSRTIFSLPFDQLKYFIASAFPFLIPFFVRRRESVLGSGSKQNSKRPPLDRRLVKARVGEMQRLLGLEDRVSFRFRGRAGLVIEPNQKAPLGL